MGAIGDGLKIGAWITDRINQVSKWLKFKNRVNYVKKIKSDVANDNDSAVNDELRRLKELSDERKEQ